MLSLSVPTHPMGDTHRCPVLCLLWASKKRLRMGSSVRSQCPLETDLSLEGEKWIFQSQLIGPRYLLDFLPTHEDQG